MAFLARNTQIAEMQIECAPGEAGEIGTARQRRYYRPEDREQLLEEFERSGQSVHDFCRDRGVGKSSLATWRRHRRRAVGSVGASELVRVAISKQSDGGPAVSSRVLIRLKDGQQIEVAPGTDVAWVAELTRRLAACSG